MKFIYGAIGIISLVASMMACGSSGQSTSSTGPTAEPLQLPQFPPGVQHDSVALPSGDVLDYTISVPRSYDGTSPVPLVIALHYGGEVTPGYGAGLIEELIQPGLGSLGAILVAPDALGGDDWTSSANEQAVELLTRSILQGYEVDPQKVIITGYSMGGEGAWFIGGRHQDLFTVAIPIEGDPAGRNWEWKIPVYVLHSRDDEVIPIGPVEQHVQKLRNQGTLITLRAVNGITHYETEKFVGPLREAVPWLQALWPQ